MQLFGGGGLKYQGPGIVADILNIYATSGERLTKEENVWGKDGKCLEDSNSRQIPALYYTIIILINII